MDNFIRIKKVYHKTVGLGKSKELVYFWVLLSVSRKYIFHEQVKCTKKVYFLVNEQSVSDNFILCG